MERRFAPGQTVQTPLGKGVILEVRNARRVLVQLQERTVLVATADIAAVAPAKPKSGRSRRAQEPRVATNAGRNSTPSVSRVRTLDLHGMTVDAALDTLTAALDEALLADVGELRVVHGRSGGRIRAAVHARLRDLPVVRAFRLDPRNDGVTIVVL
jgi:DNA mismatch repair protein MutS2